MAPRDTKATPRVQQRPISKTNTTKKPAISTSCIKKAMTSNNVVQKTPLKAKNSTECTRKSTMPVAATPKPKDKLPAVPQNVTRSAKKTWMRRPQPAHSGVPVPEKMKKLLGKRMSELDCSF